MFDIGGAGGGVGIAGGGGMDICILMGALIASTTLSSVLKVI